MSNQEQILVIKHGALGDMVQALDGFATLRAGHPNAHLALLTTAPFKTLAEAMPFFDEVIIDPRAKAWNISAMFNMRALFRRGWTCIYDFQSSSRTRRYLDLFVPQNVTFIGAHPKSTIQLGDMTGINNRDRMVRTAALGGCQPCEARTDWFDAEASMIQTPYAVLIPGCSPAKPAKRWPAEQFATLSSLLLAQGMTPYLAGTAIDREVGDLITSVQPLVVDKIGKTSLMGLASLLRHASLVIGNDTGPVFLAARLGAPTIMVMSRHTDPDMSAPVGAKAGWIKDDDIAKITPQDVMAAAKTI